MLNTVMTFTNMNNYISKRSLKDYDHNSQNLSDRYKKVINQMALILATKNTDHNIGTVILSHLYKYLEKKVQYKYWKN